MAQKKEDTKLKKQIAWLTKKLQDYDFAIRAGARADQYLLEQNCVLMKFADNIMISWKEFQVDIDKMNKDFAKKK